jgi:hypothetical protein
MHSFFSKLSSKKQHLQQLRSPNLGQFAKSQPEIILTSVLYYMRVLYANLIPLFFAVFCQKME